MSVIAFLRELLGAGLDLDGALIAAERFEQKTTADQAAKIAARREKDAIRQQAKRERERHAVSQPVTRSHADGERSRGPSPHVGERDARVVITTSSSLQSEEGTQEANASFVDAPSAKSTPADPEKPKTKPPKATRGTRLPEDWEPSADEFDLGRQAGLTDEEIHRAALEFRNYWCSRSRDAAKLSWRLTWHNRVNDIGERKQRASARLAAAADQPGAGRRGTVSFADLYARRHGTSAG